LRGVEIEGIEHRGTDIPNVVVGQINTFSQHPNADRLSLCDVDDGTEHHRQIVCGAKNFKAGDKVLVALPGAALPNGLKIKVSKLRGVESQGCFAARASCICPMTAMGCSFLSPDAQVGTPIGQLFPADTILDVEITPNRSDLLSYTGLAREIAALTGKTARPPEIAEPATSRDSVRIAALRECPFYPRGGSRTSTCAEPRWLRAKLEAAGPAARSTTSSTSPNFVMLELGQPLHAFDADKLQGGINVRSRMRERNSSRSTAGRTRCGRQLMIAMMRTRGRDRRRDGRRGQRRHESTLQLCC
jgi:phenylalanyl-tRNA synthetase beta chain